MTPANTETAALSQTLVDAGVLFHQRGWVPATGGNFSARLASDRLLITASGWPKGRLDASAFVTTDLNGVPVGVPGQAGAKTSYETQLHCQIYRRLPMAGCVLHTHSIANTVLSRQRSELVLSGYELLKVLPAVETHEARVALPVFDNDQDIDRLAARVDAHMLRYPQLPAYLIAGHGLYTWGPTVLQAQYAVEALEFMFECELRSLEVNR